MDYFVKKRNEVLYWVLIVFLSLTACTKNEIIPDDSSIGPIDNFVSSLDTSLIHSQDEYGAIFLENISYSIRSDQYDALEKISFKVFPKSKNSLVDTFTVSYSKGYIDNKGYFDSTLKQITFPVFGLFDAHVNTVSITNIFSDGKKWENTINIETNQYGHSEANNMNVITPINNIGLSYMFMETDFGAMIMDIEGNMRWVADEFLTKTTNSSVFFDNNIYSKKQNSPFNELLKLGFDGSQDSISVECGDYPGAAFHHEINLSDNGFLLELHIKDGQSLVKRGSVLIEVDKNGKHLETWDMDEIIGRCLVESGVPVDTFIRNASNSSKAMDWFHMNSACYDGRDNSVLISSRENFVIKVGYNDKQIKWILGDTTKFWHSIDTLSHYALDLTEGNINIGQHSLSFIENGELLIYNNGDNSSVPFFPKDKLGAVYSNSFVSGYTISEENMTAKETFNIELPFFCPNRGFVQKSEEIFIVTSIPVQPEFNSVISIYDEAGNLLLNVINYRYFCVRASKFSNVLDY